MYIRPLMSIQNKSLNKKEEAWEAQARAMFIPDYINKLCQSKKQ